MIIKNYLDKSIWPSLLLFPLANMGLFFFLSGNTASFANIDVFIIVKQIVLLIFVAVAEELFFRGLLLRELLFSFQVKPILAGIIVSAVFGALHLMNVFSYASLTYAIVQGLCAFAVGFDLAAIYYRFKNIVPCILIHALINVTSIGLDDGAIKLALTNVEVGLLLFVAVLYFVHAYRMFNNRCYFNK